MQSVDTSLRSLLATLPHPADKDILDPLVTEALSRAKASSSPEIRRNQWEYALKREIFALAVGVYDAIAEIDYQLQHVTPGDRRSSIERPEHTLLRESMR